MNEPTILREPPEFTLLHGGPLFRLLRRVHLSGDSLELLTRRIVAAACITWLPLLVLSAVAGSAFTEANGIPFLHDIEAHVRFLLTLPILIGADLHAHLQLRPVAKRFVERGIIAPEDMPKFYQAVDSTLRATQSFIAEIVLLVVVYTFGLWASQNLLAFGKASWFAVPDGGAMRLTAAGYWGFYVSLPIFQFVMLRWCYRFLLWSWFLWRVSRLNLRLVPLHPDRAAGLSFLGRSTYAFAPILVAFGTLLAALIATRIFFAEQDLLSFKFQALGFLAFFVAATLSPLVVFMPHLSRAKRQGLGEYGTLASRYAGAFQEKWLRGNTPPNEELLGSADVQSLADLGNSYEAVREMRSVPFAWKDVTTLAAAMAVPLLPLAFTVFSPQEVLSYLFGVLF